MSTQYGNGFNAFGGFNGMVAPSQVQPATKVQSWLTKSEIDSLQKNGNGFTLNVTNEDVVRGTCNHRTERGDLALIDNGNGTWTCSVCGHTFGINTDITEDDVKKATGLILDILQTIKLMYVSMPQNVGREFFQIIPLIEKIPKLYTIASNDFKKFDNIGGYIDGTPMNAFAVFSNMTTPGFGGMGMAQPQYQQPMGQQPMMNGQPYMGGYPGMMNQPMPQQPYYPNQQVAPGANPFYANPTGGYPAYNPGVAPQQPGGFALNPQGAAAPAPTAPTSAPTQPQAPTPTAPTQSAGPVKVDSGLKA